MRNKPLPKETLATRTYEKDKVFINYEPSAPNRGAILVYSHYQLYMGEKSVLVKIFNKNNRDETIITNIILEGGEREKVYYQVVKRLPLFQLDKFKEHWSKAKLQVMYARQELDGKRKPTLLAGRTIPDAVRKNGELVEIKTDNEKLFDWKDAGNFVFAKYTQQYKLAKNVKVNLDKKQKEFIDLGIFNYRNANSLLVDKFKAAEEFLNLNKLAKKLGFADTSMITKHLNGERDITREQAIQYGEYFGCDPADILFPKPLVKIWGHVDFIHGITADARFVQGEVAAQAKENFNECPRDIYRPDVRAVKVVSPGSFLDNQVLFYYESKQNKGKVGELCVVGIETEEPDFDFHSKTYHIGIYENVRGKIKFVNPDPYAEGNFKDLVIKNNASIFFSSPIVGIINLSVAKGARKNSINAFKKAQQIQERIRDIENRKLIEQQARLKVKTKIQVKELERAIKELDKFIGVKNNELDDLKFEDDLQNLREAKKRK
jgi:hypothetical protein